MVPLGVALARGHPLAVQFGQRPRPTLSRPSDCEQVPHSESQGFQCTVSQHGQKSHSKCIGEFQDNCPEFRWLRLQLLFLLPLLLAQLQVCEPGRDWGSLERSARSDHS